MWMSIGSYTAVPETPPLNTSTAGCIWNGTSPANSTESHFIEPSVPPAMYVYNQQHNNNITSEADTVRKYLKLCQSLWLFECETIVSVFYYGTHSAV